LVVLTPKGALRSPLAASPIASLASGLFRTVLPDNTVEEASRVLLCSGKIAHELQAERDKRHATRVAVVRLEQLYPFPKSDLEEALLAHRSATEIVWVQEEPRNMGALDYVRPRLQEILGERHIVTVTRAERASPATGSAHAHRREQATLVQIALSGPRPPGPPARAIHTSPPSPPPA